MEFNNLIGELTDEQFRDWIFSWIDEDFFINIINDWEDDIKKEEIENLKKILKSQERREVKQGSLIER